MDFKRTFLLWFASPIVVAACGSSGAGPDGGFSGSGAGGSIAGSNSGNSAGSSVGSTAGNSAGSGAGSAGGGSSGNAAASGSVSSGATTSSEGGPAGDDAGADAAAADAVTGGPPPDANYPAMVDAGAATPIGDQTQPRKLYIENRCTYSIWNFALPQNTFPGSVPLKIDSGQAFAVGWPNKWSGRIWPRSACTGTGGGLKCAQTGNDTLVEFTLTAGMASDWYDISLVDGFTIPAGIIQLDAPWTPSPTYVPGGKLGADGKCGSPVCAVDLLVNCPASQQRKDATGKVVVCVNGQNPGPIASYFKAGCPTSYSWPFDDPQSLFTCPDFVQNNGVGAKDYKIIYCPTQGSTPGFP
jgi:hypothetical protein